MLKSELKNYFLRCAEPQFLFFAFVNLCEKTFWAILRRAVPRHIELTQPKEIAKLRKLIIGRGFPVLPGFIDNHVFDGRLKLAIGYFDFESLPNWLQDFDDQEVAISLQRWNWLLYGLTDNSLQISRVQGIALIRSWLRTCLQDEHFGKDAYSVSERIVNGSIFLLSTGDRSVPDDIGIAFQFMGKQISQNLEYYEGERTGNHAFNNGRGLFFAGVLSGLPNAVELAFSIFKERLPKLVTTDGFLREASAHYHFLFTRWILEIHWLALRNGYGEVAQFIKPYAERLVRRCWFFLILDEENGCWHIPLVGDISPDFPPSWLVTLPWCNLATNVFRPEQLPFCQEDKGWASLFGLSGGSVEKATLGNLSFPQSFWHRVTHDEFTLVVHAEAVNGDLRADHRHLDLGGFVLYRSGQPIFIDTGRYDYTQSELSQYGRSAYSHNTIFVNNLAPDADAPSWFQKQYKAVRVETEVIKSDDVTVLILRHNGFDRLAKIKVKHERRFTLKSSSFEIEDQLFGAEPCHVMLRLHLAPRVFMARANEFTWTDSSIEATLNIDNQLQQESILGSSAAPIAGVFSSEYGAIGECQTLELTGHLALSATIKNKLLFRK